MEDALEVIERLNPRFHSFITVLHESAAAAAKESQSRLARGAGKGPLDGIPVSVKDVLYIKGVRCTAGSKILSDSIAPYDAPAVRMLKDAGAVIVGTTNMHEFAAGVTSENPHFGPVRNPWDPARVAGGSSGGSAASVSMGMSVAALGTDTACSVRIPASLCGIVGMKPTYGRVSRLGVIPLAPSFDTVGTLTSTVRDAASVLQAIAGHQEGGSTTGTTPVPSYSEGLAGERRTFRVGVPRGYFASGVNQQVLESFSKFLDDLRSLGCKLEDIELEGVQEAAARFYPIRRAEATAFHLGWLDKTPELYGEDVRKLLELGRGVSAVDYIAALNARPSLIEAFSRSMGGCDVMVVPCTTVSAPKIGEGSVSISGKQVDTYSALNRLTLPFNVTGFPAMSVPMMPAEGLPIGAQIVARPFDEPVIFAVGAEYEEEFGPFPTPPPA
ncbi:MAG: amidase [Thaumarchaeota archaeon]|nr:amidase [Nitrososphaerota archaeon]